MSMVIASLSDVKAKDTTRHLSDDSTVIADENGIAIFYNNGIVATIVEIHDGVHKVLRIAISIMDHIKSVVPH